MSFFTTTQVLDGKKTADQLLETLAAEIRTFRNHFIKLVVVLVGDNPASQIYVNKKAKVARKIGMTSEILTFPASITQDQLNQEIDRLNADASVHGVLIQLPLPSHLDTLAVINRVAPEKDVDGLHPVNLGKLLTGDPAAVHPCTPAGIMAMLRSYKVPVAGRHAVIVGRSNIVGKPMGLLLLQEHATVTFAHSRTPNLADVTREADILVAAVGVPGLIGADHVKEGVVAIDVGINRVDGRIVGDIDYEAVAPKASFITPVPGGVGPMTIATLMANTVMQFKRRLKSE